MRESSSSTGSACASRIRCLALLSPPARRLRTAGRSMHSWPTSSLPARSGSSPSARHDRARRQRRRDTRGGRPVGADPRRTGGGGRALPSAALRLTPSSNLGDARRRCLHRGRHAPRRRGCGACNRVARHGACSLCAGHRPCNRAGTPRPCPVRRNPPSPSIGRHSRRRRATMRSRPTSTSASPHSCVSPRESSAASCTAEHAARAGRRVSTILRCGAEPSRPTGSCTSTPGAASRLRRWTRRSRSNDRCLSGRSRTVRRGCTHGSSAGQPTSTARAGSSPRCWVSYGRGTTRRERRTHCGT